MTAKLSLSEAVRKHMLFRGYRIKQTATAANLHPNTISRVINDPDYHPDEKVMLGLQRAFRLAEPTDIWRDPWELDLERRTIPLQTEPPGQRPCIEIDDLPKVLVQDDGKPLNPIQQEALRSFIETIKKIGGKK